MTVTLTIKQVPEPLARQLRRRAERNRRSLQGELLCIVEAAASQDATTVTEPAAPHYSTMLQSRTRGSVPKRVSHPRDLGTSSESAAIIRADRDSRTLANQLRGRATARLSTDEIMRLTRGA